MKGEDQLAKSLECTFHLACLRGPDRGAVLALRTGTNLGREVGLTDPFTSRRHLEIREGKHGPILANISATNKVRMRLRTCHYAKHRLRFWMGANLWQVRERTELRPWVPPQPKNRASRLIRFTPFLLLLPMMFLLQRVRFSQAMSLFTYPFTFVLLATVSLSLALLLARLRRLYCERRDPAALAIAVAAQVMALPLEASQQGSPPPVSTRAVLTRPGRGPGTSIPTRGECAVVGTWAGEYALWLEGQARLNEQPRTSTSWITAVQLEDLGRPVASVLPSFPIAGRLWAAQMRSILANPNEEVSSLPVKVSLKELDIEGEVEQLVARWQDTAAGLVATVGITESGPARINLEADGPHGLVVGGTGSGKSEFLSTLVVSLAATHSPTALRFIFLDFKGGAGLGHLASIPHVEQCLTDLDGSQTPWLIRVVRALLLTRKRQLAKVGFRSLNDWAQASHQNEDVPSAPPSIVIVADEVRVLATTHPELLEELLAVCAQGRSLGIHLIAATQRLGGAITSDMRAVMDLRVAFRCSERSDSLDVLGNANAFDLPRLPGRGILGTETFHSALVEDPKWWVENLTAAGAHIGAFTMTPAIPLPLPETVESSLLTPSSIGVQEEPESAEVTPLRWDGSPMLLAGPVESKPELEDLAAIIALSELRDDPSSYLVWAGDIPPRFSFALPSPPPSLGDIAYLLDQLPLLTKAKGPIILVVPEWSRTVSALEVAAGPAGTQDVLAPLTKLSEEGLLRFVVTDTHPSRRVLEFPTRFLHLPTLDATRIPELFQLLPAGPLAIRHHMVSSVFGRGTFTANGLSSRPVQLATRGEAKATGIALKTRSSILVPSRPATIEEGLTRGHNPDLDRALDAGCGVALIGSSDLSLQRIKQFLRHDYPAVAVKTLGQADWPQLVSAREAVVLAVEPSREICRVMSAHDPRASFWTTVSFPFPKDSGLISVEGRVFRPNSSDYERSVMGHTAGDLNSMPLSLDRTVSITET